MNHRPFSLSCWNETGSGPIHSNPVVPKLQIWVGPHRRHMTAGAIGLRVSLANCGRFPAASGAVASYALLPVVVGIRSAQCIVRRVARQAGQPVSACLETLTLLKIRRLMTYVPGIGEIVRNVAPIRRLMARAAKIQNLARRQGTRVPDSRTDLLRVSGIRRARVAFPGAMASLAPHAEFRQSNLLPHCDSSPTCRMALKTTEHRPAGADDLEYLARSFHCRTRGQSAMSWGNIEQISVGIKAESVLEIGASTESAHERNTVRSGAKSPVDRYLDFRGRRTRIPYSGARQTVLILEQEFETAPKLRTGREAPGEGVFGGAGQCSRVPGRRLSLKLRGMTRAARLRADKAIGCERGYTHKHRKRKLYNRQY